MIGQGARQEAMNHQSRHQRNRPLGQHFASLLSGALLLLFGLTGGPFLTAQDEEPVKTMKPAAKPKAKAKAPAARSKGAERSSRPVPVFAFENGVNPPQAAAGNADDDDDAPAPPRSEEEDGAAAKNTTPPGNSPPAIDLEEEGQEEPSEAGSAAPPSASPKEAKAPVTRNGRLENPPKARGFALGAETPAEEPPPPGGKTEADSKTSSKPGGPAGALNKNQAAPAPAPKQATSKQAPPPGAPGGAAPPPGGAVVPAQGGAAAPGQGGAAVPAQQGPGGAPRVQGGAPQGPATRVPANAPPAQGGANLPARQDATILPEPNRKGQAVYLTEGKIALMDFLRFLSSYTGLPLLHDSTDQNIARDITIAADIQEADEDLVKAILEVNRFRVFRETLPSGKEVLKVESMMPAAAPGAEDAKETQILDLRGGVEKAPEQPPSPDEFATMVFELKYTAPRDASEALNNLVGSATGRVGPAGAAAGGGRSGTKSFNMVEVKNTQMLIITAKFGLLNYIKKLLQLIDVPVREPERQIHIIEVEEADPEELVSIINEFLGQGMGGGARGGLGRSRLGGASRLGQPTQGATPPVPGQVGGLQGQNEYRTNLIPDARTNKIIVETYSPQDYHDIQMLIGELDIRFDLKRLRTHIYQVRYLKAVEVAADLQSLLAGSAGGGLSGLRRSAGGSTGAARSTGGRFASRRSTARSGPLGAPGGPGATTPGGAGGGANAPIPSLIVPHEPTNSLLIQAEPEEFDEIQNVLSKIDTKRRQVFLEAALVQVQSQSALNYTIELIAGNPDDVATRALFASSFGLTGIDFDNFERTVPDLSDPAAVPPGGLAAIMHRGKLPAIVRFFKSNRDSQILATPFVLADDNMENAIEILETRFVVNTATVNTSTTSSQQGEPAGITLALTPTISGSERAVFLEMELTVSEFQEAAAAAQPTLPPKNENKMTSSVTIPDGEVFVVGGLTRQNKSKAVSKVPIIGDIPIIGKLFRSESTVQNQNNLYIFLQAHILTDEEFRDGQELTGQAEDKMHTFDPSLKPTQFEKPQTPRKAQAIDEDAQRTFNLNESGDEFYRGRHRRSGTATRGKAAGGAEGSAGPPSARVRNQENTTSGQKQPTTRDGWLLAPAGGETEYQDQGEE